MMDTIVRKRAVFMRAGSGKRGFPEAGMRAAVNAVSELSRIFEKLVSDGRIAIVEGDDGKLTVKKQPAPAAPGRG